MSNSECCFLSVTRLLSLSLLSLSVMCVIIVVIIAVIVLMSLSAIVLLLLTPSSLLSLLLSFSQHQVLFAIVAVNVLYVVLCYMLCRYH